MNEEQQKESTPIKKPSEVEEQIAFCNNQIDRLNKIVIELEDRLSSVTKEKKEGEKIGKDELALTPLANQIRAMGNAVNNEVDSLRGIIERLEI